ncbi:MAG: hypothetical protein L0I84_01950 [Halomonas subglaciescola]|nr:hypothetical protein [Halomonas subglaciescola]
MTASKHSTEVQQHLDALADCRGGKRTEATLLRLNEQEFYLLNLVADLAAHRGYASRQAWIREMVMGAVRAELKQADGLAGLVEACSDLLPESSIL